MGKTNIAIWLPKLTPQERNDVLFALKCFNCIKYQRLRLDGLMFVDRDDARAAVRMWGPQALASKLDSDLTFPR
jgi:hypothetical protein